MIYNSIFVSISNDRLEEFENIECYKLIYRNLDKSYFLSSNKWDTFVNILKLSDMVDLKLLSAEQVSIVTSTIPNFGKEVSQLIARTLLKVPSCDSIEDIMQVFNNDQHFIERLIDSLREDSDISKNLLSYTKELERLREDYNTEINSIKENTVKRIAKIEKDLSNKYENEILHLKEEIRTITNSKDETISNLETYCEFYKDKLTELMDICKSMNKRISSLTKERSELIEIINEKRGR